MKGADSIPCPHFNITIIKRSDGQSAVAGAAYQSGERLFSQYDQKWKSYADKRGIVHAEILLPPNAPPEFADRSTLWNSAEAAEKQWNAQLARRIILALPVEVPAEQYPQMLREYCNEQFVSKGMCADFAVHDADGHNPHAHIMLTLRPLDENGRWLPKSRKVYELDENGNRIRLPSGNWKSHRENTNDWNEQTNCELWRHDWEVVQNRCLEQNGRPERVDLRSCERQGIEQIPTVHLGPAASQMERRGERTGLGDLNREIREANSLIRRIRSAVKSLRSWIADLTELQTGDPADPMSGNVQRILLDYLAVRKAERQDWAAAGKNKAQVNDLKEVMAASAFLERHRIVTLGDLADHLNRTGEKAEGLRSQIRSGSRRLRDIDAIFRAADTLTELKPVYNEYRSIRWKSKKEKFREEHSEELDRYEKAFRLLKKLDVGLPLDANALRREQAQLERGNEALRDELEAVNAELKDLKQVRKCVRKVLPGVLPAGPNERESILEQLTVNRPPESGRAEQRRLESERGL